MTWLSPRHRWVLQNIQPGRILDVGFAGSGNQPDNLSAAIQMGFPTSTVILLDSNRKKVARLGRPNSVVGDGKNLPFKARTFDTVVLGEVLEHHLDINPFITEAFRVLKPSGVFLLTTPNPYGLFRWLKHYLLADRPTTKKNVSAFLGYIEHQMFYEPLSLSHLLTASGFRHVDFTTTNPSWPHLPGHWRELTIPFWPLNRLGTYSCFRATK